LQGKEKRKEEEGLQRGCTFWSCGAGSPLQAWTHPKAGTVSRIYGGRWSQGSSLHLITTPPLKKRLVREIYIAKKNGWRLYAVFKPLTASQAEEGYPRGSN